MYPINVVPHPPIDVILMSIHLSVCVFISYLAVSDNKIRKTARIRNRYNQVPHLSQDTKWESNKITINITNKSQEVSPCPSGDHKAATLVLLNLYSSS